MTAKRLLSIMLVIISSCSASVKQAVYVFSHGLNCNHTQSNYYEKVHDLQEYINSAGNYQLDLTLQHQVRSWYIERLIDLDFWVIKQPIISFNYPDASEKNGYDPSKTSLGQENEIQALKNAYHQAQAISDTIVLMGMSRGASTILNFLGTQPAKNIEAVVIESPFDSIINMLRTRLQQAKVHWIPNFVTDTAPYVIFGQYDHNGIFPISVITNIKNDLPIFIICSLEDSLIPAINSAQIYFKLIENGNKNTYFLLLNKGAHAYLLWHDDGDLYLNAVHAFYKKYGLPYNPSLALHGELILAQCQPIKEEVEKAIAKNSSYIQR